MKIGLTNSQMIFEDFMVSTLSAVKSNVFFEKFKVKSNGKKSEVLDFTFFITVQRWGLIV